MQMSPSITALVTALLAARKKFGKIIKDKTAEVKSEGKSGFRYKYADLASVLEATVDPLADEGVLLTQWMGTSAAGKPALTTMLVHVSGEFFSDAMDLPGLGDRPTPQQLGSLISYLKRYCASASLAVVSEEDNDGGGKDKAEKPEKKPATGPTIGAITSAQQQRLFAAAKTAGISKERVQEILWEVAAVTKSKDLPADKLPAILKAMSGGADAAK